MKHDLPTQYPFSPSEDPAFEKDIAMIDMVKKTLMKHGDPERKWGTSGEMLAPRAIRSLIQGNADAFRREYTLAIASIERVVPFREMPPNTVDFVRTAIVDATCVRISLPLQNLSSRSHALKGSSFMYKEQIDMIQQMWERFVAWLGSEENAKSILRSYNTAVVELSSKILTTPLHTLMVEAEHIRKQAMTLLIERTGAQKAS